MCQCGTLPINSLRIVDTKGKLIVAMETRGRGDRLLEVVFLSVAVSAVLNNLCI